MKNYNVLLNLLKKVQSINFYYFIFFSVIGMIFETLSVGLIIPILTQLINPEVIMEQKKILNILILISPINFINNNSSINILPTEENKIIFSMFFLFFIFYY